MILSSTDSNGKSFMRKSKSPNTLLFTCLLLYSLRPTACPPHSNYYSKKIKPPLPACRVVAFGEDGSYPRRLRDCHPERSRRISDSTIIANAGKTHQFQCTSAFLTKPVGCEMLSFTRVVLIIILLSTRIQTKSCGTQITPNSKLRLSRVLWIFKKSAFAVKGTLLA